MIGFGSIGRGTLPLIERHIAFDRSKFVVIDPVDTDRELLDERKLKFIKSALTKENYREVLTPLLTGGPGRGMIVNLSVDTSSVDLMEFCQGHRRALHRHRRRAVAGLLHRPKITTCRSARTMRCASACSSCAAARPGGVTAVNCCGANPGMVSWFVKQALLDVARDTGLELDEPKTPRGLGGG